MASVNDLILESNVRERLYPAMPFKILQIYMKTANRYAYASCFSGNIFPKRKRISGPQYISCQKKATGKFMKVVWSHTATNWEPAFLNKIVAIKLMIGQDVYKRQVQEGYKEGIEWLHKLVTEDLVDPEAFTQEWSTYVAKGKNHRYGPVSYTHLDVYKRQIWCRTYRSRQG